MLPTCKRCHRVVPDNSFCTVNFEFTEIRHLYFYCPSCDRRVGSAVPHELLSLAGLSLLDIPYHIVSQTKGQVNVPAPITGEVRWWDDTSESCMAVRNLPSKPDNWKAEKWLRTQEERAQAKKEQKQRRKERMERESIMKAESSIRKEEKSKQRSAQWEGIEERAREQSRLLNELRSMPYQDYLKSDHWKRKRKEALQRAECSCQVCNAKTSLEVHHRTYERRGYEKPADLIVLCRTCHSKFHDKLP